VSSEGDHAEERWILTGGGKQNRSCLREARTSRAASIVPTGRRRAVQMLALVAATNTIRARCLSGLNADLERASMLAQNTERAPWVESKITSSAWPWLYRAASSCLLSGAKLHVA
jgi:hypothetical protein